MYLPDSRAYTVAAHWPAEHSTNVNKMFSVSSRMLLLVTKGSHTDFWNLYWQGCKILPYRRVHVTFVWVWFPEPIPSSNTLAQLERPISFVSKGLRGSGSQAASQPARRRRFGPRSRVSRTNRTGGRRTKGHDGWMDGGRHRKNYIQCSDGRTLLFVFLPRTLLVLEQERLLGSAKNPLSNMIIFNEGIDAL